MCTKYFLQDFSDRVDGVFFPSHWHTHSTCGQILCLSSTNPLSYEVATSGHPTGSLRVTQCSVRWKAHVPTSPLNDRAADHFKQATRSKTFHLLVEGCWSHWAGTLESCLGLWTHVCVCKCNVFYCVYSLWVHVYARTDLCSQVPPHKCVCVCTSVHMSALEFFCPAVWNTADVFSSPPRKPPPLSPSLSSHSHLARSSAHTPQCLYATALQIISWLHYLSPFLPLVISSLLPSISLYPSKHVTTWDFFKLNLSKLKAFSGLRWSKCCFKIGLLDLGGLKTWYICYFLHCCFASTAKKDINNLIQGSEAHTQSTLTMINGP